MNQSTVNHSYVLVLHQLIASAISTLIFIFLFGLKRQFFPSDIIFYESILFSGLFICILAILSFRLKIIKANMLFPSLLLITLFNTLVPTILDRSVSITVLATLRNCNTECDQQYISREFQRVYLVDNSAINKRLLEQLSSGNIVLIDDAFELTKKGEFVLKTVSNLTDFFNIERSYIDQH
tara:strand:+ start:806 stop:1348 length:543 start_codon:yes stop_codon:yes gene_type:complete